MRSATWCVRRGSRIRRRCGLLFFLFLFFLFLFFCFFFFFLPTVVVGGMRRASFFGASALLSRSDRCCSCRWAQNLDKAIKYMEDVKVHKRIVPFTRYHKGIGRSAQAKNFKASGSLGRWPVKSCEYMLGLLQNLKSNASAKVCVRA